MLTINDSEILNNYYEFLKDTHRPKTANMYFYLLNHFADYLHSIRKGLHYCTASDIQSYINTKKTWSNTAKVHFLVIVKTFFSRYYINKIPVGVTTEELRYKMQRENDIREIVNYPLPHIEKHNEPKAINLSIVKTLLDYVKKKNVSEYCLIYVSFYFGMRKGELIYINPSTEINWKENWLEVTAEKSKTHSGRVLYFNDYVKQCLIQILKTYGSKERLINKEETYLNKVFLRYSRVVGVHLYPHVARHTFNTCMLIALKGKLNIDEKMVVRSLMGHKNTGEDSITSIYTNLGDAPKKAMLDYHYMNGFINLK